MADYTLSALAFAKVFQKDLVEIGNSSAGFLRRLDVVSYPGISKDWVVMDSDGYDQRDSTFLKWEASQPTRPIPS
jgi:hypothetical protein